MLVNEAQKGAVVVTGANAGIGAGCVQRLAEQGYQVFAGARSARSLDVVRALGLAGVTPVEIDVTDERTVAAAGEQIAATVGDVGLVGLVNNAGIAVGGPLEVIPMADLRRQFETNVIGVAALTQVLLPLIRRGGGRIVNVGSTSGRVAAPFAGPYAMSKFALRAYSDALRVELNPWKIRVSLIEVGPVATGIWDKSLSELDERWNSISPSARELYGPLFAAIRKAAEQRGKTGIPVERVVDAVLLGLFAEKPRTRYVVGKIARQIAVVSMLPDRIRDRLVLRQLGLN